MRVAWAVMVCCRLAAMWWWRRGGSGTAMFGDGVSVSGGSVLVESVDALVGVGRTVEVSLWCVDRKACVWRARVRRWS